MFLSGWLHSDGLIWIFINLKIKQSTNDKWTHFDWLMLCKYLLGNGLCSYHLKWKVNNAKKRLLFKLPLSSLFKSLTHCVPRVCIKSECGYLASWGWNRSKKRPWSRTLLTVWSQSSYFNSLSLHLFPSTGCNENFLLACLALNTIMVPA